MLCEGVSTKSTPAHPTLTGRTDGNKRVVFSTSTSNGSSSSCRTDNSIDSVSVPHIGWFDSSSTVWDGRGMTREQVEAALSNDMQRILGNSSSSSSDINIISSSSSDNSDSNNSKRTTTSSNNFSGRYIVVKIMHAQNTTLKGVAIGESSIEEWHRREQRIAQQKALI